MTELPRFAACGAGAFIADVGTYALVVRHGMPPLVAHLVSRPLGGAVSFLGNRFWTFGRRRLSRSLGGQVRCYAIVWLATYLLTEGLIFLLLRAIPGRPVAAKILAEGLAGLFSFLAQRSWTFRDDASAAPG